MGEGVSASGQRDALDTETGHTQGGSHVARHRPKPMQSQQNTVILTDWMVSKSDSRAGEVVTVAAVE